MKTHQKVEHLFGFGFVGSCVSFSHLGEPFSQLDERQIPRKEGEKKRVAPEGAKGCSRREGLEAPQALVHSLGPPDLS